MALSGVWSFGGFPGAKRARSVNQNERRGLGRWGHPPSGDCAASPRVFCACSAVFSLSVWCAHDQFFLQGGWGSGTLRGSLFFPLDFPTDCAPPFCGGARTARRGLCVHWQAHRRAPPAPTPPTTPFSASRCFQTTRCPCPPPTSAWAGVAWAHHCCPCELRLVAALDLLETVGALWPPRARVCRLSRPQSGHCVWVGCKLGAVHGAPGTVRCGSGGTRWVRLCRARALKKAPPPRPFPQTRSPHFGPLLSWT